MSAGISTMYKLSGGCVVMKRCADCAYLEEETEAVRFGRKHKCYRCKKHPAADRYPDWKPNYTACQYHEEASVREIFVERENGQLSFF